MPAAKNKGKSNVVSMIFRRYFIDAMSAMALGLFSSLIIGLILSQLGKIPGLSFLAAFSSVLGASSPVVGASIGTAVAWGLGASPLVIFSCVACGAYGYSLGGPVGAFIAAVFGAELGGLVSGKTKLDIVLTPMVTIVAGGVAGLLAGPFVQSLMSGLGEAINRATELAPFPMGILVAVMVGMALTAPISSAALCIMLGLDGIAAGAAAVGCCAQMVGFAVASFSENGLGGLLSQGLGTSMLQFGNIMRRPQIWIAPTLAGAILGPVSTCLLKMTNTPTGAGMGTSGLVGQFGAFAAMTAEHSAGVVLLEIALMHFILPALLTLGIDKALRRLGWVKKGDMTLSKIK